MTDPVVVIGAEGDPAYEFTRLRTALFLPTGFLAVADSRTAAVRLFDPSGRAKGTLGRDGEGPGEFRSVDGLFLAADTIIAYDWRLRRLTRYLATGTFVRTDRLLPAVDDGAVGVVGQLANGRWLVRTQTSPTWTRGHGVYRDTMRLGTMAPTGSGPVEWIGQFPGMTIFAYMPGSDKKQWAVGQLPVSANAELAALADTIVVGDTETPDLLLVLPDGRLVRRIALPVGPSPDMQSHRRAARDARLARLRGRGNPDHVEASFRVRRPTPQYQDLIVGSGNRLWVRLFEPSPNDSTRYIVVDPTGGVRAQVSFPPRSRVLTVQHPWVVAALRDEDDVERVAVYRWTSP